ncbi:[Fe-Fe] hydrogenase large subunit C-terminal domain-containing protein [Herbinix luporum]|jgi:iron only hydrogenase large subunit-like protein|uniref:[Fe-Fe] hydrogenase large subunit C-terminal domain-containing protein n=1 Tax=Herbinix luporum TaxID=1679721 RepID=UPI001754229C|nr:[Fe-Fe] hydrogenase large subunit C-terminal domain-containing protein [Herbinix luporum]MDI9488948.1 [Fe-Fe] hydrogenase large subunit C-terminal domain-containing protein [Bacillota bacterium]HHT56256.1 iron hydrogenase [Herbinix luporum]
MKRFDELYEELLKATIDNREEEYIENLDAFDAHQLDCLLNPKKHPLVWSTKSCECPKDDRHCVKVCPFHAIFPDESGQLQVDEAACAGCSYCIQECRAKRLTASKDAISVLRALRSHKGLSYALIAPAFLGQFKDVTPGKLRTAFKKIGFDGMLEVALFADILTLKEALEFDRNINTKEDFQLTSCCCPVWIAWIKNIYNDLIPHVPPSVSPMIASGRAVKTLYPDALTVFVGPCLAKKAEARDKDIAGAIDYVLTFQEVQDIFNIMEIDPAKMEESEKDHSSRAGRIYAHTGGVSEAVKLTLERINPNREITLQTQKADGVKACRDLIKDILAGKTTANFYEGMGCEGGCVGGPKALIPHKEGRKNVEEYGKAAAYPTPIDNPYVIELLKQLGFETIDSLLDESDIFTRNFLSNTKK